MGIIPVMLVRDIGEFQLIDKLAQVLTDSNAQSFRKLDEHGFRLNLSIGDDAASWEGPSGIRVLTTDTMVERIHFDLSYTNWRDLGWKSLATNLSDIAAMGCMPMYSIVTLGLRGDLPVEGLLEMYEGLAEISQEFGGAVVGGDIVKSPAFFTTVALEGASLDPSGAILTRSSARPGDKVAVTGHLGCSGGGLKVLMGDANVQSNREAIEHLKATHNRPIPRVQQGLELVRRGVVTAMDVSDGLVDDLEKLCRASGVGAVINVDSVPADNYLKEAFPQDWLALALGGGEDYELLFTAPNKVMKNLTSINDAPISIIGEIVEGDSIVRVLDNQGNPISLAHTGWDHFRE